MNSFVRNLITEWRRLDLPVANVSVLVAVSGGADSLALLLALDELKKLKKLDVRLIAAHFNHRLRGDEAERDEEFVRHLTAERKIELAVGHADLASDGNVEQNARNARYEFLQKTAENVGAVAVLTAHTQNDQAETFLLNLIRGSGPAGLCGMPVVRHLEKEKEKQKDGETNKESSDLITPSPLLPFSSNPVLLVRPLLNWAKRLDTENYCRDSRVEFRYDSMNEDLNFKRVRVRKILLPMLEEFNPRIVETLANTARLMGQPSPERPNNQPVPETGGQFLSVRELKSLPQPELYRTLREWLGRQRGNLRQLHLKHIEAIERLVLSQKSGRLVELPGGETVMKTGGKLAFKDLKVEKSPPAI